MSREEMLFMGTVLGFVEEKFPQETTYADLFAALDKIAVGMSGCMGLLYLDMQLSNRGFVNLFASGLGVACLPAMKSLQRIGALQLASVVKSAMELAIEAPEFAGFEPAALEEVSHIHSHCGDFSDFEPLDELFYEAVRVTPGFERYPREPVPSLFGVVDYYGEHYPSDFPAECKWQGDAT